MYPFVRHMIMCLFCARGKIMLEFFQGNRRKELMMTECSVIAVIDSTWLNGNSCDWIATIVLVCIRVSRHHHYDQRGAEAWY